MASTLKKRSHPSPQTNCAPAANLTDHTIPPATSVCQRVSQALERELQSLAEAVDAQPLCTLSGQAVSAGKYYEGRVVATRELARLCRHSPSLTPEDLSDLAEELQRDKTAAFGEAAKNDHAWASYLAGLVDACQEFSSR